MVLVGVVVVRIMDGCSVVLAGVVVVVMVVGCRLLWWLGK